MAPTDVLTRSIVDLVRSDRLKITKPPLTCDTPTSTSCLSPGVWNVWPRLAASGWRLAGVWTSGRLAVWG
eukprot:6414916-Prymnesium_polylepis.1